MTPVMLDLFSGIGGFSLAGRWAGFTTAQFVEIDPFCQKVLAKNFPGVPIHADVKSFRGERLRGSIDLLTGGFPCQDVAGVNRNANGLAGSRSGLWYEMHRIIGECSPRYCVIENVPDLRSRGLEAVLTTLAAIGYSAEWHTLSAADAGAPHGRCRLFIIAYPAGKSKYEQNTVFSPVRSGGNAWGNAGCGDWTQIPAADWAVPQSAKSRVDDGLPGGLDRDRLSRLKALGNAIVPQVVLPILQAIHSELTTEGGRIDSI